MKSFCYIISLLIFLMLSNLLIAQDIVEKEITKRPLKDDFGAWFTFDVTHAYIDFTELNKQLQASIYPKMDVPFAVTGFGFQVNIRRYLFGMSWNYSVKEVDNPTYRTESVYQDFNAMIFGYDMMLKRKMSLFPYIGIRTTDLEYIYFEKSGFDGSFTDYLNEDLDIKSFGNERFDLDLGVGFSFNGSFLLKVKGGYLIPIQENELFIENMNTSIGKSPDISYPFYFTATIGIGGIDDE